MKSKDLCSGFNIHNEISRFRPNIIVGGRSPTEASEDDWSSIEFADENSGCSLDDCIDESMTGSLKFDVVGPCSRCKMIDINQSTGIMDGRYLEALSSYRKIGSRINFGQFLVMNSKLEEIVEAHQNLIYSASHEVINAFQKKGLVLFEGMCCNPKLKDKTNNDV